MSGLGAACAERLGAEGVEVVRLDVTAGADAVVDVTDFFAATPFSSSDHDPLLIGLQVQGRGPR